MEDLKDLTINVKLEELHQLMGRYEQRRDFIFPTIWSTFAESERHETITNRIITISSEIILLQTILRPYVEEKEYNAKLQQLNEELETVKELRSKTSMNAELRKGTIDGEYERVYGVLSQL